MKRAVHISLINWKNDTYRKPLVIQGARQVGKTHTIKQFGKEEYKQCIYLNFEEDPELAKLFNGNLSPKNILKNISLYFGKNITPQTTLIFFDEIQIVPKALTSLKYFYEQAPEYHVISAGSLLGVSVGKQSSFPVGKVNFISMNPLSFGEFLLALGESLLADTIKDLDKVRSLPSIVHHKLLEQYKLYLYLGGMPEVLAKYVEHNNIIQAREIQKEIIKAYQQDFSKYTTSSQAVKTSEVWNSIPFQLAKENKKFKYGDVQKKARSTTYELTIEWLKKAGLIHLVYQVSTPKLPLPGYSDNSKFKVYMVDTGLLGAMLSVKSDIILNPDRLFSEYNGAFIENFVSSQLIAFGEEKLFYWTSGRLAEVDFLVAKGNNIHPIEVKSGTNRNIKSLRSYESKYNPKLIYRLSQREYQQTGNFINVPLYAIEGFITYLNEL